MSKATYYRDEQGVMAFGNKLREIRLKKAYTQERLANECDLPPSQISRIETGAINTSLSHICLIARILKVKPRDLMDFTRLSLSQYLLYQVYQTIQYPDYKSYKQKEHPQPNKIVQYFTNEIHLLKF